MSLCTLVTAQFIGQAIAGGDKQKIFEKRYRHRDSGLQLITFSTHHAIASLRRGLVEGIVNPF